MPRTPDQKPPDPLPFAASTRAVSAFAAVSFGCAFAPLAGTLSADSVASPTAEPSHAPFAAFVALLTGALVSLQLRRTSPPVRAAVVAGAGTVTLGGIAATAAGTTPLSAAAALSLALAGGAIVLLATRAPPTPRRRIAVLATALLLGFVHATVLLGYRVGVPLLMSAGAPLLMWHAGTFVALAAALATAAGARDTFVEFFLGEAPARPGEHPAKYRLRGTLLLRTFLTASLLAVATGYALLRVRLEDRRAAVTDTLAHVAELRVAQIEAWRHERRADIRTLSQSPLLSARLAAPAARSPLLGADAPLGRFLEEFRAAYGYGAVAVFDRDGRAVESVAAAATPAPTEISPTQLSTIARSHDASVDDLVRHPDGAVTLDYLAPIRSANGTFLGALLVRADARRQLFPLLRTWPSVSPTAESVLVRRERDGLLFLSELRFRPDSALRLHQSSARLPLPPAPIAKSGPASLIDGSDYRGEPVLFVASRVADSAWWLMAKIDRAEAFAPVRRETWQLATILVLGLLAAGLVSGHYWRNRQQRYEQQHDETERERRAAVERLALVLRHANDIILLFDENMRVVEANDRALAAYGHTLAEMRRLNAMDLRSAGASSTTSQDFAGTIALGGLVFESEHRRKDGSVFPVEVSTRPVEIEGRQHVFSIIRDITQRRASDAEIARLSRMFLVISQVNQALVRAKDREQLFAEICRVLIDIGQFRIAWIGWLNAETRLIEPVSSAGDTHNYVSGIRISADPAVPEGRGPSGTAFREGRIYVCNDFFADPGTVPWRERAQRSGFRSTIALPLRCEGEVVGLLTVYATERDFFQPRQIEQLEETAGDISFALGIFAGDARRLAAEAAVRASENRLQFLLTATPAVIYSLRAGGDYAATFLSPNIRDVLGYTPAELTSGPDFWRERLHPDDVAHALAAFAELGEKSVSAREYRFRHADGSWRWMHDETRLVRDAAGQPVEFVGYWIDITARKEAEAALASREEIFSSIVGQALDAIALVDVATGRFLEFNRASHESLGYTRAEFAAFGIGDIQAEHAAEEISRNIALILEQGGTSFESRHRHRDGSLRDVRVSARHLHVQGRDCIAAVWSDITESKRAEAQLRKLSLAVEQSPTAIVITAVSGAIEYVNPRFTAVTGYTLEEVRGRTPRVLKSGTTPPEVYADLWQTITAGREWRGEIVNRKKSGEFFTDQVVITPVKDAAGRITHFLSIKEDITERRKVRLALEESEAKFRRLLTMVPLPLGHSDKHGRITFANERFQQVFGYTLAEVPTVEAWWARAYPDPAYSAALAEKWSRALRQAAANDGLIPSIESTITCRDGRVRTVELSGILLGEEMLVVFVDITARVQAELEIRKLSRMIEQAPLSVAVTDLSGAIEYVNPTFLAVTGYTREEVIGQNPRVLKSGHTPPSVYVDMWQTLVRGEVWRGELTNRKKSGEIYHERAVIAPVTDETGHVTHFVAMKEDITDRKRTEAALQETQERYRLIAENTNDAIWLYDLANARFVYSSPSIFRLLGYTSEERMNLGLTGTLTAESAAMVARVLPERLARFAEGDRSLLTHIDQIDQRHRDGRIIPTEISTTLIADATGRAGHILGVTRDITERRRAEAVLRESEQRYRELFDLESDAILLLEADSGRIIRANQAAGQMYGATVAELETLRNVDLSDEPDETLATARLPAHRDSTILNVPYRRHRRRDGTLFPVEITLRFFERDGRWFYLTAIRDITARRQAEAELRESRDRLAKAEQIARLGNWAFDLATGRMTWSDEMFHLLELDPVSAQPSAELWLSFVAPEERATLQNLFSELLATHRQFAVGARLLMPAGGTKYVAATGEMVFAPDGTPLRAIGTVQDITDGKLVEIELHELVKGLRALHQISQAFEQRDLACEPLMELVVRELPAAMCYPEDTRVEIAIYHHTRSAGAAGPLLDQLSVPIQVNDHTAGQLTVGYVRPHPIVSRSPFYVREQEVLENIARTIGLGLGKREAFEAVQRFNSELESMVAFRTNELDARNREVQALLESVPDMVMRLRRDGSVLDCRQAKGATPLADPHYVAGLGSSSEATAGLRNAVFTTGARALAENTTVSAEAELPLPTGTVAVEMRAAPIGTEEFVVFVRDITARKHLEAEAAAMLEKERQVSEMKTRFISVTSHEFRTPMAAAMGSVELLRNHLDRMSPAKREELFARIDTSMRRMTQMLDEILTLSRIDAGRVRPQLTPLDLPAFVRSMVEEIRLGDHDGHEFQFSAEGDASQFPSDANLLHHIVSNLLSNAARYSPPASVVTVRLTADDHSVVLTVEDQGIGIPAADRERIFEAFERGSNVGNIKGTGLGLNIVKRMTEMLAGTIRAEAAAERGTRFILQLPRHSSAPS